MSPSADVAIVGAGMAGAAAALVLERQGARVALIDPRPVCESRFKAEKIAQDQARMAKKLGLLDILAPHAGKVREVRCAFDGRVFQTVAMEQYGMPYPRMVDALRASLPKRVDFRLGYVRSIQNAPEGQRLTLNGGEEIAARLVVLACGLNPRLQTSLGFQRRLIRKDQCFVLGFPVAPAGRESFGFDALTIYPSDTRDRIDYLAIFKYPQNMRANLFVFRTGEDPWVARFRADPMKGLEAAVPKIRGLLGDYRIPGTVDFGSVNLYIMEGIAPGVVVIGDAYQSACPGTGLGMNKIFTDVEVLAECLPSWLAGPRIGKEELLRYYEDPRKRAMDRQVIQLADIERRAVLDSSLRWRLRRLVSRMKMRWAMGGPSRWS